MPGDGDLAGLASLIGGTRAELLLSLLAGDPLSAGQLANQAHISPSLASAHLARLRGGDLVAVEQDGRRRLYSLASPEVAHVLETMLSIAAPRPVTSLRESKNGAAIRRARTCYDHLAGRLGVTLTQTLHDQHFIGDPDGGYQLTDAGRERLEDFGLDIDLLQRGRRAFTRACLDWTEHHPHLAGALGAGIADRLLTLGWVRRTNNSRALQITRTGQEQLRDEFGLDLAA